MDAKIARQEVLKTEYDLAFGTCEDAIALDRSQSHLWVLASNCEEPRCVKFVEALCA